MINLNAIPTIIEKPNTPFDIKFIEEEGSIITMYEVHCTSSRFRPRTYKIKSQQSLEFRTVRHSTIIEINQTKTYL